MENLDLLRSRHILEVYPDASVRADIAKYAQKLIPLIYSNGLVGAIAYAKGDEHLSLVCTLIQKWMEVHPYYQIKRDLVDFLLMPKEDEKSLVDSFHIMLYRKEILAYLGWVKRLKN